MSLVKRACPLCKADNYSIVVTLKQDHFTKNNPSYRVDRIPELDLDPDQLYPIGSCCQCGMVYTLYYLDDEREAIVYNRIIDPEVSRAKVLTVGRRMGDLKRWLNLLALVNDSKPAKLDLKLVDYGCGWGTLLQVAQGPGVMAVGFDVTSWKVAWARKQGITICNSEEELLAKAPFDLCVSTSVLEHLRDPDEAVKTMARLLKPGGYALITCIVGDVANPSGWKNIRKRLARGLPIPKEINPWEHLNYFTHETLIKMLGASGFVPLKSPGGWVGGNNVALQCAEIILKKYLPLKWPKRWISGYWQIKKT